MNFDEPPTFFDLLRVIGEGSYGSVYKALDTRTGKVVAIKKVPIDEDFDDVIKEVQFLHSLSHRFIVHYEGAYYNSDERELWIVLEFCGAGAISSLMERCNRCLSEDEVSAVIRQAVLGLEYLHTLPAPIIHRDVKANNILIDQAQGMVRLADFGVSATISRTLSRRKTVIGTPFWMAPEVIQEVGYGPSADIWSVGITAIELAEGRPPLSDLHPMRAMFKIPNLPSPTLTDPLHWSDEFNSFIALALRKDPETRPSATQLLAHPFLARFSDNQASALILDLIEQADAADRAREGLEQPEEADVPAGYATTVPSDTVAFAAGTSRPGQYGTVAASAVPTFLSALEAAAEKEVQELAALGRDALQSRLTRIGHQVEDLLKEQTLLQRALQSL
jgi:serine/threonine protein kinase